MSLNRGKYSQKSMLSKWLPAHEFEMWVKYLSIRRGLRVDSQSTGFNRIYIAFKSHATRNKLNMNGNGNKKVKEKK